MTLIFQRKYVKDLCVMIESEEGTSTDPARVLIFSGAEIIAEVTAKVERKPGADGGFYNCVTLEKK